jgi:hypothetical protein
MKHPLVAVHHQLVGTAYEADLVVAAEVLAHIATKKVPSTTGAQAPSLNILCKTAQTCQQSIRTHSILQHKLTQQKAQAQVLGRFIGVVCAHLHHTTRRHALTSSNA